jgi:hypothetical protein
VIHRYARVGACWQTLDAQLAELHADGCARIYREKASGTAHRARFAADAEGARLRRRGDGEGKANGKGLGRPFKMTGHQRQEALARRESGELLTEIARSNTVSAATISRLAA